MAMSNATLWMIIGFTGQALFSARFLVQWIVSERKRDAVVPVAFWWLSLLGGLTLLSYASYQQEPVFIVGQGMGLVVYARNLMLVGKAKRRAARRRRRSETVEAGPEPHSAHAPHPPRNRVQVVEPAAEEMTHAG